VSVVEKASELALKDVPAFALRRKSEADVLFDELVGHSPARSETIRPSATSETRPNSGEALSSDDMARLFSSTM